LKFLNAGKHYDADVLVLGGDLTGKMLVPIVEDGAGRWSATYLGEPVRVEGEEALRELEKNIRFNGHYPYRCQPEEMRALESDPQAVARLFNQVMLDGVERWARIAEERIAGTVRGCYIMPGNDDLPEVSKVLDSAQGIVNPEGKVVQFEDGVTMISDGYSNRTPWNSPRELDEPQLRERIDKMARQVPDVHRCIFNLHVPPYGSSLDNAPQLTSDLAVVREGGQTAMVPVGSTAVRDAIQELQPMVGLHGHVHESRGMVRLGKTLCMNPGSEYGEGVLHGAVVEVNKGRLRGYQMVVG
jgi:Icc-related predicted phosphoesterase